MRFPTPDIHRFLREQGVSDDWPGFIDEVDKVVNDFELAPLQPEEVRGWVDRAVGVDPTVLDCLDSLAVWALDREDQEQARRDRLA